jgi:2-keto-4-pentenoate hydratase/2-oxohepta-3-ene-1,7-dioic acid hydratase in catechol pathway
VKITRFDGGRIGVVKDDVVYDVSAACGVDPGEWPPVGIVRVIADWSTMRPRIEAALKGAVGKPLAAVKLETPDPWPNKLLAMPANFRDHAQEMEGRTYAAPGGLTADKAGFFMKANSSMIGAADSIVIPAGKPDREFHYECEIAIVIGKRGRHIPVDEALDYIFGYACLVDMTMRGLEERVMRKSYETFTPVGPWITTADEVGLPFDVNMRLWVNGELRQHSQPQNMIVGIPECIAMCSEVGTLEPGDIIASGTMSGVGPVQPGDEVVIEIDRVGKMTLPVVAAAALPLPIALPVR